MNLICFYYEIAFTTKMEAGWFISRGKDRERQADKL